MRASFFSLLLISTVAAIAAAQGIPTTVEAAQAEGAAFPQAAPPTVIQSVFTHPFGGTNQRMCTWSVPDDSLTSGSLRSGEIILRSRFFGPWGLRAGKGHKMLWMPLHGPAKVSPSMSFAEWHKEAIKSPPLVLRAVRIDNPADSLRQTVLYMTGGATQFGFPSAVRFPTAGKWLVIATTGNDWGCFLLTVAE